MTRVVFSKSAFFTAALAALSSAAIPTALAQDDFARARSAVANEFADAHVELVVLPTYPKRALRNGIDGEVTVEFTVSRYGRAVDAKIVSATPRRVFDTATLDALKYWFIRPARADVCETTQQSARQTFQFRHDADPPVHVAPIVLDGLPTMLEAQTHVDSLESQVATQGFSPASDPNALVVTHRVEPEYPEKALHRRREGYVTVTFFIEKDGTVTEPKIESAKNGMLFNRAAMRAISQWEFEPAFRNGVAIERFGCHEFLFNLDARAAEEQERRIRERTRSFP